MEEFVRKLALWDTKKFKPIMTHDELEPLIATLGFVSLPPTPSGWKEYVFSAGGCCLNLLAPTEPLPRPRLPFPRIDGLHIFTYRAFFDAVRFFLVERDIADYFHVRGMPLHRSHDLPFEKKFRRMNDEEGLYVYREGTIDQVSMITYKNNNNDNNNNDNRNNNKVRNKSSTITTSLVPLKDIIV